MAPPKRILVVDDDETSLFITQKLIKKADLVAKILLAKHGQEALNIVREVCQREQCPELILLDIHMPVMNGLDLALAQQYPIIDIIQKPLTPEKLAKFL